MFKISSAQVIILVFIFILTIVVALYHEFIITKPNNPNSDKILTGYFSAIAQVPWSKVIELYELERGVRIEANYGSTGQVITLASIAGGDLLAVASIEDMMKAVKLGIVDNSTVRIVSCTVPAIIVPKGNPAGIYSIEDLARPGVRIGIGDPKSVVIGRYAVELLKYNDLWDDVKDNIVVHADSFSTLMAMLVSGQGSLDAIIGWHVGYYWYPDRTELIMLSRDIVPKATCIAIGVINDSTHKEQALDFINYVTSNEGISVFDNYGYMSQVEVLRYAQSIGGR